LAAGYLEVEIVYLSVTYFEIFLQNVQWMVIAIIMVSMLTAPDYLNTIFQSINLWKKIYGFSFEDVLG
jgi:hypothetical protein